jgi:hypothetical protein
MSKRDWKILFEDILESIDKIGFILRILISKNLYRIQ